MSIFEGAGVALVTPFKANGEINYIKLGELVEEQIAGGTDSIIVCGTTGESATLTHDEHNKAVQYVCSVTNGRIPVIAGTGSNCTATSVYLSQCAEEAGADGLLLVSPYYNKTSQRGLIAHFTEIANSVKIPVLLYNVPGRTGININPETIVALCRDVENIVGVKEASGNFTAIAQIASMSKGWVDIYSGNDDQIVPILSLGGKGVISVLSNIAPRHVHDICEAYFNGDVEKSRKMQLDAMPLISDLFCEVNPIPVKEAMNMMGKEVGPYRKPLVEMETKNKENLRKSMKEYGLLHD